VFHLNLAKEITMAVAPQMREHMEAISSDGQQGRHVDRVEGGRIKLTKSLSVLVMSVALSALCCAPPVFAQGPRQDQAARTGQAALPGPSDDLLAKLESIYKDIHANPEVAMQEQRTAGIAAEWLRQHGYEVTEKIGRTGVVGLLRNGEGPTVLLRADMDALPM
jgi:hypothetical protein